MKHVLWMLVALTATLGAQDATDPLAAAPRIAMAEFKKLLATGKVVVIDVRDEESYERGHIPGARSVPLGELERHVDVLKKESRPIVTYCA